MYKWRENFLQLGLIAIDSTDLSEAEGVFTGQKERS